MAMDPIDKRRILLTAVKGLVLGGLCGLAIGIGLLPPLPGAVISAGIAFVFGSMIVRQRQSALARARRRG